MSLDCQPEANRLVPDTAAQRQHESDAQDDDDAHQPGPSTSTSNDGHAGLARSASEAGATGGTQTSALRSPRSNTGKTSCTVHIKEPAAETRDYIKSEESHGPLHKAIPVMPLGVAILCCVLNITLPGIGTLVAAFTLLHARTSTRLRSKARAFAVNLLVAGLQLTTFIVIVGWIWSILWGMTFIQLALSENRSSQGRRTSMSYYVRRHSSVVV